MDRRHSAIICFVAHVYAQYLDIVQSEQIVAINHTASVLGPTTSPSPSPTPVSNVTATVPSSWAPETFPNPQTQPHRCGRDSRPSFICDPNNIISEHDASRLEDMISDIRLNTPCPCDAGCPEGKEGHLIGIAIMEKMDLPRGSFGTFEELQLSVERFATYLRTDAWQFSHCTNDAVIVISVQDKTIFTSPGPKARERLLSRCIDKAFLHARFKFSKEQYFDGLATILADYKQYIQQGDCPGIEGPSIAGIVLGSLFLSIVVICVLFCIYECVTRRRAAQRRRRKFDFSSSLINSAPTRGDESQSQSQSRYANFRPAGCLLPPHERSSLERDTERGRRDKAPQRERPRRPPPPQFTRQLSGRQQPSTRLLNKNDENGDSADS